MAKDSRSSSTIDRARDELFSHVRRCGVLDAEDEQRDEWLDDTVEYLAERYPELSRDDLDALRMMGQRYCSPAIRRTPAAAAVEPDEPDEAVEPDEAEAAVEAVEHDVDGGADESSPAEPEAAGEDDAVQPGEVSVA